MMSADTMMNLLQWALPAGSVGAVLSWIASRSLRQVRQQKETHDTFKAMYEDVSALLLKTQKKYEETNTIIDDLRAENRRTQRALNRLSRAIEAIQLCPYRAECPVRSELQDGEPGDGAVQPGGRRQPDPRPDAVRKGKQPDGRHGRGHADAAAAAAGGAS